MTGDPLEQARASAPGAPWGSGGLLRSIAALPLAASRAALGGLGALGAAAAPALPRGFVSLALEMLKSGAQAASRLAPAEEPGLALCELANKLETFRLFKGAGECLGSGGGAEPLARGLARAREMGPFLGLWVTEGLGYAAAREAQRRGRPLAELVRGGETAALPASALIPLHTGMGLSLAERTLQPQNQRTHGLGSADGQALGAAVDRFAEGCRAHARPGWDGVVFEALGLVARTLHPQQVAALDRHLAARGDDRGEELRALFWHGVGRGLYFAPSQALPVGRPWVRGLAKARTEPPHPLGRTNAVAGFAWALTLVNLRHPRVLAAAAGDAGANLPPAGGAAFTHGVRGASRVWLEATGERGPLLALLAHEAEPATAPAWQRLIHEPTAGALDDEGEPGDAATVARLFRLQPAQGGATP